MTFSAYDTEIEDSSREARARERQALSYGIDLLKQVQRSELEPQDEAEALLYIRRLWTFFVQDLSNSQNGLPEKLRAELISIGLWIIKEADRARQEKSRDVTELVLINSVIRDSLT